MRIAVAQVDGKWPNLALAKLAHHHRVCGDDVRWWLPLDCDGYDVLYISKTFTDTQNNGYLPPLNDQRARTIIHGGSGFDLTTRLPDDVEAAHPDWSLWPNWKHDMGYSTRGCVRRCPFCNVREKDGDLRVVAEFGDLWSGRGTLILLDANVTAAPVEHFRDLCDRATQEGVTLDFSQGLDARLLTDEHAAIVARSRLTRYIHMAFDSMGDETAVRRAIATMERAGVTVSRLTFYVLIGFNTGPEEDLYRVELLRSLGTNPFVMPFDRTQQYQRRFARWANRPALFKSCTFAEYGVAEQSEGEGE